MIKSKFNFEKKYQTRYTNPITNEIITTGCTYLKNGKNKTARVHYLVGDDWITKHDIPEYREYMKKKLSSLEGFFYAIKKTIAFRQLDLAKKGRFLIGKNEFEDGHGCYDKLQAHYDEQVERYGDKCPITGLEFTFERSNKKVGKGNSSKVITNMSPDRMLNPLNYTKQNMLFTSTGWNYLRGDFSLRDMSILMPKPYFKNYTRILLERFPDQKYKINELENTDHGPGTRRVR